MSYIKKWGENNGHGISMEKRRKHDKREKRTK